ncbi:MAG: MerR family transcriptional regulator [Bacteroidetes bacterium]|jgi:DNA-binding transcriptional MerR regulator|nr:MerR family transcriptional regulator [Bacteroidota bacterium]
MPYKEKEIEKLYYTIGEVAQMFNVNTSHIRFWSKEFDVIRPATNKKGNRMYTQPDIENFKKIYHLVKEKGFTLKGAKSELKDKKLFKHEFHSEVSEIQLHDNPIEIPIFTSSQADQDAFVNKIALKNSLAKIKSSLMDMQRDLSILEAK